MAFQRQQQQPRGKKPAWSLKLSVKQGNSYVAGPGTGFFDNEQGGPAMRSTLKGDRLKEFAEFLFNAHEAGLSVSMSMFDNSQEQQAPKQAFQPKKPTGFAPKRPNPFAKQE